MRENLRLSKEMTGGGVWILISLRTRLLKSTCLDLKTTCVDEGFALRRRDFSLCSSGVILVLLSWVSSGGVEFTP